MLYPSLHLHSGKPSDPGPSDFYLQPDAIESYRAGERGGSHIALRPGPGGDCVAFVNESPDMIAKAIQESIRGAAALAHFGAFDAQRAVQQAAQANGIAVVKRSPFITPQG